MAAPTNAAYVKKALANWHKSEVPELINDVRSWG